MEGKVDESLSVAGEVTGEVKWVQFGHKSSSYDANGKKLESKKL